MLDQQKFDILLIFIFLLRIVDGTTILQIDTKPLNETLEIPNSKVRGFKALTLCGRILTHQFASKAQKIFQIETEIGSFGFGTTPGFECDETEYQGYLNYFCSMIFFLKF